jgi:cation transport regulator
MSSKIVDYFKTVKDLPENLRKILPTHAQHIYMNAHNRALEEYKNPDSRKYGGSLEEVAHRVAWAAVKTKYEKDEKTGEWRALAGVNIPEDN